MSTARLRRALDDALWGPETGARLVVVHVGLSVLIGVRIVAGSYRQLAGTPQALVDPVPFLGWLDRMPPAEVFVALQVIGGLAALAAVLRRHPRAAFALAWVRCRRASVLVAALAWLAYFAYELGIWLRVLCKGECGPVSATGTLA